LNLVENIDTARSGREAVLRYVVSSVGRQAGLR